jgi:uncharacterized alkaline shock family protein YloU
LFIYDILSAYKSVTIYILYMRRKNMPENKGYIKSSDERGSINICQSVVAVIAAAAAVEVDGVHGLYYSHSKELTSITGSKGISRGIRINIDGDDITVEVHIITEIGYPVSDVGALVQKAVVSAIEEAVGGKVSAVNVNICGVSLKKTSK